MSGDTTRDRLRNAADGACLLVEWNEHQEQLDVDLSRAAHAVDAALSYAAIVKAARALDRAVMHGDPNEVATALRALRALLPTDEDPT